MFAIFAGSLLRGKLGYCDVAEGMTPYKINKVSCIEQGYNWKTRNVNFENIYSSLQTLFILSTLEDWPDIMNDCMDANDESIVLLLNVFLLSN